VQVQVAAKGAWQIDDVDRYTAATFEHIILVDVTNGRREFYVCPGDKLRADVRTRLDGFVASKGGTRPRNPQSKHSAIYPEQVLKSHNSCTAGQVSDPTVLEGALASLRASRYRIEDAVQAVANEPGPNAVHGSPDVWQQLGPDHQGDKPLYVGKAEGSLVARDIRTHFASGRTGSSTLLRSFAALLRDSLGLRGVPRNLNNPERPTNLATSLTPTALRLVSDARRVVR